MIKQFATIIFILFISSKPFACGNEYGYDLNGERLYTQYFYLSEYHRTFDITRIKQRIREDRSKPDYSTNFKLQSNVALNLMKLGHVDSALLILEPLAEEHPTQYIVIANLGTAYELSGKLELALKFISKGYELNKDSHLGSEWIHIKILEAKIKNKRSPGWISSHPIVTVEEVVQHEGNRPQRYIRPGHLEMQIRTRAPFTPAPNAVMANLLETLAEYHEKHGIYENALLAYIYVMEFKPTPQHKEYISQKIRALNKKRKEAGIEEIPFAFKHMIEMGEIDPQFLLMGISEFEEEQFAHDQNELAMKDSIRLLKEAVDSLSNTPKEETSIMKKQGSNLIFYIIIGLLAIAVAFLGFKLLTKK